VLFRSRTLLDCLWFASWTDESAVCVDAGQRRRNSRVHSGGWSAGGLGPDHGGGLADRLSTLDCDSHFSDRVASHSGLRSLSACDGQDHGTAPAVSDLWRPGRRGDRGGSGRVSFYSSAGEPTDCVAPLAHVCGEKAVWSPE